MLLSNQFPSFAPSQILHKSFHQVDCFRFLTVDFMSLQVSYLDSNTSFQTPPFSTPSLHFHLANRATLNFPMSLIPNPPHSFGEQTFSQAIQAIFLSSGRFFICNVLRRVLVCLHHHVSHCRKDVAASPCGHIVVWSWPHLHVAVSTLPKSKTASLRLHSFIDRSGRIDHCWLLKTQWINDTYWMYDCIRYMNLIG